MVHRVMATSARVAVPMSQEYLAGTVLVESLGPLAVQV